LGPDSAWMRRRRARWVMFLSLVFVVRSRRAKSEGCGTWMRVSPVVLRWSYTARSVSPYRRVRYDEAWVRAGPVLESPKTPFSFVVVGDASYCRGGSVIQLILHHGGSVGMTHINFAGAGWVRE